MTLKDWLALPQSERDHLRTYLEACWQDRKVRSVGHIVWWRMSDEPFGFIEKCVVWNHTVCYSNGRKANPLQPFRRKFFPSSRWPKNYAEWVRAVQRRFDNQYKD